MLTIEDLWKDKQLRPLGYVAGPYTQGEPVTNVHAAIAYGEGLMHDWPVIMHVPHVTMIWQLIRPQEYEWWMDYDQAILRRCDFMIRIPGESPGADREVRFCEKHDIPFYEIPDWTDQAYRAFLGDFLGEWAAHPHPGRSGS